MRLRGMVVGAAVLVGAVGCSGGGDGEPAAAPTTASSPPAAATASATASATPSAAASPELPDGCESLLPFTDLDQALGRPLFGQNRAISGKAQPDIGRTGRLTCYYGLPQNGRGAPPVEVGVSTYVDATSATDRVTATIASLRSGGASSQTSVTVAGLPVTVIGNRTSFTAVLAKQDRTIVVTVQRAVKGQPDRAAARIVEKILANWPD